MPNFAGDGYKALQMYVRLDHESRQRLYTWIDMSGKDHGTRGHPVNKPQQPVVRVSWQKAVQFCAWLSETTGEKFALPSEGQWEWAARAGSETDLWFGDVQADYSQFANLADGTRSKKATTPYPTTRGINDGQFIPERLGKYQANPWGLHDVHGSVFEWTASSYRPYPYDAGDGRNAPTASGRKVARGGSWRDRPQRARSAFRLPYQPYQPVFNVGFRVALLPRER